VDKWENRGYSAVKDEVLVAGKVGEKSAVARKTRKVIRKTRTTAREIRARGIPSSVPEQIFWPDRIDHVKAIAMRGVTDAEMAALMGVSPTLLESWKNYYPTLSKAIEEGRTFADAQVVAALHSNAIGYERESDEVVRTRRGAEVVTIKKFYPGETAAQKYWLQNRKPLEWDRATSVHVSTPKGQSIHVKMETKNDVINSILNMIQPRPDTV